MGNDGPDSQESTEPKYRDPEWLHQKYVVENLSTTEMGDLCGVYGSTVSTWMEKHGIDRDGERTRGGDAIEKLRDSEWVEQHFVGKDMTAREISEHLGCVPKTAVKYIRMHGHETTTRSESRTDGDISKLKDGDWLRKRYKETESTMEIADDLGLGQSTVHKYCKIHGIVTVPGPAEPLRGPDSPVWKGGYSHGRGRKWRDLRERVIERDGNRCVSCGMTSDAHKEKYGKGLTAHHIRPRVSFDDPEDSDKMGNLVTLCLPCHRKWEGIPLRPDTD